MAAQRDVVIIGAGHNGLVTAFYLARGGRKPLVLERRPVAGGAALTDEIAPGFRCPTLAHAKTERKIKVFMASVYNCLQYNP